MTMTLDAKCNFWRSFNPYMADLGKNCISSIALVSMVHLYGSCQVNRCRIYVLLGETLVFS